MRIPNEHYLIVDVEATCSNDGAVPRHEMEIIEIGAVIQSSRTFEIASEFQTFIQPVRHPELTEFCTSLTGIRQDQVANASPFPEALEAMKQWMYGFQDTLFCSWGDYDKGQFTQDCAYHHVAYPFRSGHLNLKPEFSRAFGLRKKLGIADALRHLGLDFEGAHHRGLDDAKNIARIVRRVCMRAYARSEETQMAIEYRVLFTNLTGCAIGISDISWATTVTAESEPMAKELALEQARKLNRQSGLPPHGLRVSEKELRRLMCVMPAKEK